MVNDSIMGGINYKKGTSRIVFLLYNFAIKMPRIDSGITIFYKGLLSNCYERNYYKNTNDKNVSKCHFNFLGFFCVHERCYKINEKEFEKLDIKHLNYFKDLCINNIMKDKNNVIKIVDYEK